MTAKRGGRIVLEALDIEIGEGATAVVGPSGAGKSTLLRLLNRLADPDSGRVLFGGRDLRDLDPLEVRRRAALVPQLPALLGGTVGDEVGAAHRFCKQAPDPDVEGSLSRAGLDPGYATRRSDRLSVGEAQRVMLARALALEPEVLLLDEPTSALDAAARDEIEWTLQNLETERSLNVVLVTHDRAQAKRLATRTIELSTAVPAGEGSR